MNIDIRIHFNRDGNAVTKIKKDGRVISIHYNDGFYHIHEGEFFVVIDAQSNRGELTVCLSNLGITSDDNYSAIEAIRCMKNLSYKIF